MTERRNDLAAAIMALATRKVPAAHEEWAHAMKAEFAALATGRLSWALGCLATSLRWRAAGEAGYAASLAVGVLIVMAAMPLVIAALAAFRPGEPKLVFRLLPVVICCAPLLAGLVVGTWRADRKLLSALVIGMGSQAIGLVMFAVRSSSIGSSLTDALVAYLVIGTEMTLMSFVGLLTAAGVRRLRTVRIAR
ncbi:hypothetical protein DMC25_09740 [Caulobacter sp. D4A]|uniref:hypothetical protein n=1 Tax=unclassified Caulobacter TaxID=2648921 RepID=UPI000D734086|nr:MULTISPECIES: hypothetical protein [unclassified Caulobacter]PXA89328.1 hypothetical protein DMC25_09740 [Caulobacter sp. D4A]PXA90819.1 hypothetical protein DMC18_14165 [Caulobacter sp. D5]